MTYIQERGSTHVYHVNRMSKEEMDHMISLCVHEQPAYSVLSKQTQKKCCFMLQKEILRKLWGSMRRSHHFP